MSARDLTLLPGDLALREGDVVDFEVGETSYFRRARADGSLELAEFNEWKVAARAWIVSRRAVTLIEAGPSGTPLDDRLTEVRLSDGLVVTL